MDNNISIPNKEEIKEIVKQDNLAENTVNNNIVEKNKKIFLYSLGIFVFFVLFSSIIWGVVRVRNGALDDFAYFTAKILRLPLLSVNGQKVYYTDYLEDMKAIKTMKLYEKENSNATVDLSEEQMSDQVIWRLVNNVMVAQIAKEMGVKVEKKDIEELKSQVLQQFESKDVLEKELMKRYGWNLTVYENKVIKPFVLQNKVSEKIQTNKKDIDEVRNRAEEVLEKIKQGADFAEMAKLYGEDGTASNGGNLGWFTKGEMVPQFEEAVFSLKKGELSNTLIETEFGYHIVKVNDIKNEKVKDANGKLVNKTSINASHILFMFPNFEKYMDNYLKKAKIKFYSKIHNPFELSK